MLDVLETIRKTADSGSTILITGESGTGKELVAQAVHFESGRRSRPFVSVNCGAVPETLMESELFGHVKGAFTGAVTSTEGLFSAADGGTLFLDEITEIPHSVQVKLLRAIQEREIRRVGDTKDHKVDVRLIAASNRELENVIERAIVLGGSDMLAPDALPPDVRRPHDQQDVPVELPAAGLDLEATLDQIERRYIQMALERTGGVQTRAAELLRVSFRQFRYKLQKHKPR